MNPVAALLSCDMLAGAIIMREPPEAYTTPSGPRRLEIRGMKKRRFEQFVERALDSLPDELQSLLENIVIFIDG